MDANRIDPIAITPTVSRQTPDNSFGAVMARSTGEVLRRGAGVVGGFISGSPAVSTAVAGMGSVVSAVTPVEPTPMVSRATAALGGGRGEPMAVQRAGVGGGAGQSEGWELVEAQRALQKDSQGFNLAYLRLQDEMQRESREFNAVSNIMKVRHDSAKAAINNIR